MEPNEKTDLLVAAARFAVEVRYTCERDLVRAEASLSAAKHRENQAMDNLTKWLRGGTG